MSTSATSLKKIIAQIFPAAEINRTAMSVLSLLANYLRQKHTSQ